MTASRSFRIEFGHSSTRKLEMLGWGEGELPLRTLPGGAAWEATGSKPIMSSSRIWREVKRMACPT
jgi:hypothetical protein